MGADEEAQMAVTVFSGCAFACGRTLVAETRAGAVQRAGGILPLVTLTPDFPC